MGVVLWLAQEAVPDISKVVSWADAASRLGVAGLALLIMFLSLGAVVWLWKRNAKLMAENADQWKHNSELEAKFRDKVESLMREMLDRGEDSQESQKETTNAIRDLAKAIELLTTRIEYLERASERHHSGSGGPRT